VCALNAFERPAKKYSRKTHQSPNGLQAFVQQTIWVTDSYNNNNTKIYIAHM